MSGVLTRLAGRLRTGDLVTGISRLLALACLVGLVGMLPWLSGKDPALTILRATSSDREPTPEILDSIRTSIGIDGGPSTSSGTGWPEWPAVTWAAPGSPEPTSARTPWTPSESP